MSWGMRKDKNEFAFRAAKVRKEMDAQGVDAVLLHLDKRAWAYGEFSWLSNHILIGPAAMFILPREGDPVLLVTTHPDLVMAKEMSFADDVRLTKNLAKEAGKFLGERNLLNKTIAVSGMQMGRPRTISGPASVVVQSQGPESTTANELQKVLSGAKVVPGADMMVKTMHSPGSPKEIEYLRKSASWATSPSTWP